MPVDLYLVSQIFGISEDLAHVHLCIAYNIPCVPSKILHNHFFQFILKRINNS